MKVSKNKNIEIFKSIGNWDVQANLLKEKFPQLTDDDLKFETGGEDDLLTRIGERLKMRREMVIDFIKQVQPGQGGHQEFEKSKAFFIAEIVDYAGNSTVSKTIIEKATGNVSVISLDSGEIWVDKISPFDAFVQIIDGMAEISIDDQLILLKTGQAIVIPAHTRNILKANVRFKMISTVIKSGYEEVGW